MSACHFCVFFFSGQLTNKPKNPIVLTSQCSRTFLKGDSLIKK